MPPWPGRTAAQPPRRQASRAAARWFAWRPPSFLREAHGRRAVGAVLVDVVVAVGSDHAENIRQQAGAVASDRGVAEKDHGAENSGVHADAVVHEPAAVGDD